MSARVFNVAIAGAGVVGGGVVELIKRQRPLFLAQGFDFRVKTLLCKDTKKTRDFTPEAGTALTSDPANIINDTSLDIVVEVMGGSSGTAKDIVLGAAANRQHVVTANKALLADALPQLAKAFPSQQTLARAHSETVDHQASTEGTTTKKKRRGVNSRRPAHTLNYEAAVAGGIPIIKTMRQSLLTDTLYSVKGIMNGTTNFILTKMHKEGLSYDEALKQAQQEGFAEADPTADVEGHDARNKLVLLAELAYGVYVPPARVFCEGISRVSDIDFEFAAELGCTVKLLGVADRVLEYEEEIEENFYSVTSAPGTIPDAEEEAAAIKSGKPQLYLDMFVSPSLVESDSELGKTAGAMNLVLVNGASTGITSYKGAGAGRYATANSILADMVSVATSTAGTSPFNRPSPAAMGSNSIRFDGGRHAHRQWYLRAPKNITKHISSRVWDDLTWMSAHASSSSNSSGSHHKGHEGYDAMIVSDQTRAEMTRYITAAVRASAPAGGEKTVGIDGASDAAGKSNNKKEKNRAFDSVVCFPVFD